MDAGIDPGDMVRVDRISRELAKVARTLDRPDARYLVTAYYNAQQERIRAMAQIREAKKSGKPDAIIDLLDHFLAGFRIAEQNAKKSLQGFAEGQKIGEWAMSIMGIGPVLAAGLMAHIDIEKAPHAGHIFSFAGLNPQQEWNKGEKRPWNADLKVLCWKIGQSFVKSKSREGSFYGPIFDEQKAIYIARNEAGEYKQRAADILASKNFRNETVTKSALQSGVLSDGHIDAMARRYAIKFFLSHWHYVAYEDHHGSPPARPWIIEFGGHSDFQPPPNWADGKMVS